MGKLRKIGKKVEKNIKSAGRSIDRAVNKKLGGWGNVLTGGVLGMAKGAYDFANPEFDFPDPAIPAAGAVQLSEEVPAPEMGDGRTGSLSRSKRKGRSALRIDRSGGGSVSGLNIPR